MKLNKDYWESRYQNNEIGWNVGQPTTPLKEYFNQIKNKNLKILIPGAGNGYEFSYLVENGFNNVFVIDIASTPIDYLKNKHPEYQNQIILGDFFDLEDTYDLIIEQTFFCAINPVKRIDYLNKTYQLLNESGKITGVLFDFPLTNEGPPFGGCYNEYYHLFKTKYNISILEKCKNSIKPRHGREFFIKFEKK